MVCDQHFQKLESISRISNLPIIESSWHVAEQFYYRLKKSNTIFDWSLCTAENSMNFAFGITLPITMSALELPIQVLDKIVCKSLDVVEHQVPSIHLTPEKIYNQTKEYVDEKFLRPVLKRANSVKQLGNNVLENKYTEIAAGTLDDAIITVDKYMDHYLPDDDLSKDETDDVYDQIVNENTKKAVQTIHRVDRFSRKLQRRLTKRTIREARALKDHSTEIYHNVLYALQLVVTNPKGALENSIEIWKLLSKDEPENQKPPNTFDELIAILLRESARRIVHLINNASKIVSQICPLITHHILILTHVSVNFCIKAIQVDVMKNVSLKGYDIKQLWLQSNTLTTVICENFALLCAGQKSINNSNCNSNAYANANANASQIKNLSTNNLSCKQNNCHLFTNNVRNGIE